MIICILLVISRHTWLLFVVYYYVIRSAWILLHKSERDSLTVSALACHAADLGSNPAIFTLYAWINIKSHFCLNTFPLNKQQQPEVRRIVCIKIDILMVQKLFENRSRVVRGDTLTCRGNLCMLITIFFYQFQKWLKKFHSYF